MIDSIIYEPCHLTYINVEMCSNNINSTYLLRNITVLQCQLSNLIAVSQETDYGAVYVKSFVNM